MLALWQDRPDRCTLAWYCTMRMCLQLAHVGRTEHTVIHYCLHTNSHELTRPSHCVLIRDEAYFRAMLRAQPHLLAAPAEELRARLQLLREVASAPGSAGLATAAAPGGDSMRRSSGAAAGGGGGGGGHGGWLPAWGSELALATPAKLGALLHTSRRRLLRLRYVRQQLEAVSAAAAAAASKSSSGGSSSSSSSGLEPWQQQRLQQERQRQEQQMLGRWRPAEPMMAVVRYRGAEWARRHPGYADWEANYLRQEREHAEAITEWTLAYP